MPRARSPFVVCAISSALALVLSCSSFESGSSSNTPSSPDGSPVETDGAPIGSEDGSLPDGGTAGCANANLATDPKNCGRCGRDCGLGACTVGECEPYKVKCEDVSAPFYIAVDDTHVYWTSRGSGGFKGDNKIHRRSKNDLNALNEAIGPTLDGVFAIALSSTHVFATVADGKAEAGLHQLSKDGSFHTKRRGGNTLDLGLTQDATRIYFMNEGFRWVTSDPNDSMVNTMRDALGFGEGVAVDATHAYWTIHALADQGGSVWRVPLNGAAGSEEQWIPMIGFPRRITIDADAVYIVLSSNDGLGGAPVRSGKVLRRAKNGGVQTLVDNVNTGRGGIVVDDRFAYMTLEDEGEVIRVDKTNGANRRLLQKGLEQPIGIAQDASSLWFSDSATACLWRMTK